MLLALVLGLVTGGSSALASALRAAPGAPPAGVPVAEFEPCTLPRVECFLVADPDGTEVAAVRLLRLDTPGHTLLERDIVFRAEGQRVHHTERLAGAQRRLVWRELGPRGGAVWVAEWDLSDASAGARLTTVGHGSARATHAAEAAAAPWIGPLEWLEAARSGALAELGPVAWLTPGRAASGARVAPVEAALPNPSPRGPEGLCTVSQGALLGFELLVPGRRATPCSLAAYEAFVARYAYRPAPRHPYVEAALRRGDTLRRLAAGNEWRVLLNP